MKVPAPGIEPGSSCASQEIQELLSGALTITATARRLRNLVKRQISPQRQIQTGMGVKKSATENNGPFT